MATIDETRDTAGEVLARCLKMLEAEESLRGVAFTPDEEPLLAGFGFLSRKSVIALFNVDEARAGKDLPDAYRSELERLQIPGLALSAKVEMEVAQLDEKDRESFLTELGIKEPARDRFIRASYKLNADRQIIEDTLRATFGATDGKLNLNNSAADQLAEKLREPLLQAGVALSEQELQDVVKNIETFRASKGGILSSFDQLAGVQGVTPQVLAAVKQQCGLGPFTILSAEVVGHLPDDKETQ